MHSPRRWFTSVALLIHQMLIIILLFQTLDIAVVCSGHSTSRQVVILIKSILFYRRNPLHFHFVSDKTAITILTTLFQSWNIPLGKRIHLYAVLHDQKRHSLVMGCQFYQLVANCQQAATSLLVSPSCNYKSVKIRLVVTRHWQTCSKPLDNTF